MWYETTKALLQPAMTGVFLDWLASEINREDGAA